MMTSDPFWITILWAFLSVLTNSLGFSYISEKILFALSSITDRRAHKEFVNSWKELANARRILGEISAQDEFSRWAKQQRLVDKLQAESDNIKGKRQRAAMAKQVGLSLALRILFYLIGFWWLAFRTTGAGMIPLKEEIFGPLKTILSYPNAPSGYLSSSMLYLITLGAFYRFARFIPKTCKYTPLMVLDRLVLLNTFPSSPPPPTHRKLINKGLIVPTMTNLLLPELFGGVPNFSPRLFTKTVILWNESKILARLLYKSKNQHRSAIFFHKLQQIMRNMKNMAKLELYLQSCYEKGQSVQKGYLDGIIKLCENLQTSCLIAYRHLEQNYNDTYFVPLAITGMALVSRINLCTKFLIDEIPSATSKLVILDKDTNS